MSTMFPRIREAIVKGPNCSKINARYGEACDHPGCLHHLKHPCEGCGRIAGRGWYYADLKKAAETLSELDAITLLNPRMTRVHYDAMIAAAKCVSSVLECRSLHESALLNAKIARGEMP